MGITTLNRVDLKKLAKSIDAAKADPKEAKKVNRVDGEWILDETQGPQFRAEVKTEKASFTLEADSPSFLGGGGTRPSPLHYCMYGVASCFASTFASVASGKGIILRKLRVSAECDINFSKTFGLGDAPIVERVSLVLQVLSDAKGKKLEEILKLAEERCPAVFSFKNPITVKASFQK